MPIYAKSLVRRALKRLIGCDLVPARSEIWLGSNLVEVLRQARVTCVLDVGAHHGEYGLLLRDNGYRGRIISFEPVSASFAQLRSVSSRERNWEARQLALGDRDGEVEINVTRHTPFSSVLAPLSADPPGRTDHLEGLMQVDRVEHVNLRRLDSVFAECMRDTTQPRVFLKMDTQGFDAQVFQGAAGCLDSIYGIQTELSIVPLYDGMPGYLEVIAGFERAGFELSGLFPVTHDAQMRAVELDCLMVRTAR